MDDLEELKKLAGVEEYKSYHTTSLENISQTASEKKKIEREQGIKPGDPEWFELWFSLPYMTGNNAPKFRGRKKR